jgi:hypothetical protein
MRLPRHGASGWLRAHGDNPGAATTPVGAPADVRNLRHAYYRFVDAGPKPSLIVIEDLDGANAGYGAFCGEVQSAIHRGLGAVGLVTNGSIRDLPQWAPGFQVLAGSVGPSHAFANLVAFDVPVTIAGMPIRTGDLVHADRHGAVVIPPAAVRDLPGGTAGRRPRGAHPRCGARTRLHRGKAHRSFRGAGRHPLARSSHANKQARARLRLVVTQ